MSAGLSGHAAPSSLPRPPLAAGGPDATLTELAADYQQLLEDGEVPNTDEGMDRLMGRQDALVHAITTTPAATIADLAAKLRVAVLYGGLEDCPDSLVTHAFLSALEDAERLARRAAS